MRVNVIHEPVVPVEPKVTQVILTLSFDEANRLYDWISSIGSMDINRENGQTIAEKLLGLASNKYIPYWHGPGSTVEFVDALTNAGIRGRKG